MSDKCFDVDQLEMLLQLPIDDPRRLHLEECPRCRSLLVSYQAFLDPPDEPEGAYLQDAHLRLRTALRREILGEAPGEETEETSAEEWERPEKERGPGLIVRFLQRLWEPPLRPALAAAAVLVVAFGLYRTLDFGSPPGGPTVLRGGSEGRVDAGVREASRILENGRVQLTWGAGMAVDSYLVRFYDAELSELLLLNAGRDTALVLDPAVHPVLVQALDKGPVYWRVTAVQGGDEVSHTKLQSFP